MSFALLREVLFVGGVLDGEVREIDVNQDYFATHRTEHSPESVETRQVRYKKEILRSKEKDHYIFRLDGLTTGDVLDILIGCYSNCKSLRGKHDDPTQH